MLNIGSAKIQLIMRNLVSNAYTMCATFFSNIVGISGKVRLVSFFRHKNISKISSVCLTNDSIFISGSFSNLHSEFFMELFCILLHSFKRISKKSHKSACKHTFCDFTWSNTNVSSQNYSREWSKSNMTIHNTSNLLTRYSLVTRIPADKMNHDISRSPA